MDVAAVVAVASALVGALLGAAANAWFAGRRERARDERAERVADLDALARQLRELDTLVGELNRSTVRRSDLERLAELLHAVREKVAGVEAVVSMLLGYHHDAG